MQKFKVSESTGRWILVATILASSMAFIDGSALNIALSALQNDLGATGADLIWIVNGYLLMLAALILIGGSLGDHYGRNRVFAGGIILFTAASVACGLSPSPGLLIAARAVQGVGGALMVPQSLAIIAALFEPGERGQAIGWWSAASTITTVGGPALGGWLVNALSWRYVFFINVPLALLALFALTHIPENKDENAAPGIDWIGALLVTLGLAGLTFGLVALGDPAIAAGLGTGAAWLALAAGIVLLAAFVLYEARAAHPMIDLGLFRSRTFSGTNLMTLFLYGALGAVTFLLSLNLIQAQGYREDQAGQAFIPFGLVLALLSPRMGALVDRYGPRRYMIGGPLLVAAGFFALGLVGKTSGPDSFWTTFFPALMLVGVGMGITVTPLTTAVMTALPSAVSGIASGINNAAARSAQVLMTAVAGALALVLFTGGVTALAETLQDDGQRAALIAEAAKLANAVPPEGLAPAQAQEVAAGLDTAFLDAFRVVAWLSAALAVLSAGITALFLRDAPQAASRPERGGGRAEVQ